MESQVRVPWHSPPPPTSVNHHCHMATSRWWWSDYNIHRGKRPCYNKWQGHNDKDTVNSILQNHICICSIGRNPHAHWKRFVCSELIFNLNIIQTAGSGGMLSDCGVCEPPLPTSLTSTPITENREGGEKHQHYILLFQRSDWPSDQSGKSELWNYWLALLLSV